MRTLDHASPALDTTPESTAHRTDPERAPRQAQQKASGTSWILNPAAQRRALQAVTSAVRPRLTQPLQERLGQRACHIQGAPAINLWPSSAQAVGAGPMPCRTAAGQKTVPEAGFHHGLSQERPGVSGQWVLHRAAGPASPLEQNHSAQASVSAPNSSKSDAQGSACIANRTANAPDRARATQIPA